MEVGLNAGVVAEAAADARRAEDLGFDLFACGEHLFFHVAPNPFIELAAAAAVTTSIRLVSSINLLPLYPAALVAKLAATLDQVSAGRFELGVGAGGESPAEFAAVGVDMASRFRRMDEGLTILKALFTGESTTYAGEFATLDGVQLNPGPVQPGGPPIWLGGRKDGSVRRAGRYASRWMPYMVTPAMYAEGLGRVREAAVAAGRAEGDVRGALMAFVGVDADAATARARGIAAVSATYSQDFTDLADKYLVLGSADQVLTRLGEYAEAGVDTLVLQVAAGHEHRDEVLEAIAAEVLPHLR